MPVTTNSQNLMPLDADAGEARGLLVGADREDRAADPRGVQDDPEDHGQHDEQQERVRDLGAGRCVPKPQSVYCGGKSATAVSPSTT